MTVHSTQLGAHAAVGGLTSIYVCPAGKRAIVKSIWVRNTGTAQTGEVQLALNTGTVVNFFVPLAATPAAGSTVYLAVWLVLNPGDALKWASGSSQTTDIFVAGTELTL